MDTNPMCMPAPTANVVIALMAAACCASCTTIRIDNHDGRVSVERSFGIARVNIAPDAGVVTAKVASVGYVSTAMGHSLGWSTQTITTSDDGCRVIVWLEGDGPQRENIYRELEHVGSVCITE